MNLREYTQRVKSRILNGGADLVGIADAGPLKALALNPIDLLDGYECAVSIAIRLPTAIFDTISKRPTPIYSATYQTVNRMLDELALHTALSLEKDGFRSLPIPASQVLDRKEWSGAISHKAVARMAGLGWQGKNLLLITPQYGSKVRLVTVLTNAPLIVDAPIKNRCGNCAYGLPIPRFKSPIEHPHFSFLLCINISFSISIYIFLLCIENIKLTSIHAINSGMQKSIGVRKCRGK